MGSVYEIYNSPNVHKVRQAEYEGAVSVRAAQNKLSAAQTSLAEFSRSLGNNLRVEAAGKEYNEAINAVGQQLEQRTTLRINASMSASEKIGQLEAGAAAAGVGGSSIELLSKTVELQRNIEQDLQRVATDRIAKQGARQSAEIMNTANMSRDLSRTFGNFDFKINVAPVPLKYRYLKLLGVAAATYFGGPQAGQAAADAAVGEWKANNGDNAAASQYMGRAVSGALASVKDWGGGDTDSNSWFGRVMASSKVKGDNSAEIQWNTVDGDPNNDSGNRFAFGGGYGSSWTG